MARTVHSKESVSEWEQAAYEVGQRFIGVNQYSAQASEALDVAFEELAGRFADVDAYDLMEAIERGMAGR